MTTARIEVQRTVDAEPAAIFAILCDPQGHVAIDSSGMLMSAEGEPVTAVRNKFVVHMDPEALNDYPELGRYEKRTTAAECPEETTGTAGLQTSLPRAAAPFSA